MVNLPITLSNISFSSLHVVYLMTDKSSRSCRTSKVY